MKVISYVDCVDEEKPWTEESKAAFALTLKGHTQIESVRFGSSDEDLHILFKKEIDFYCMKKLSKHTKLKRADKRQESLDVENMFESMLKLVENKDKTKKMPVRKFFNNTFGTLLNDAIFALQKKQWKEPKNEHLFTVQGSVKFVAQYLQENLPEHEREPDMYDAQEGEEERD